MRRQPEMLADATIQPIMFVLLFAFVFGGAIHVPGGGSYRSFLMGGIFAQTIVFGAFGVAIALAHDRTNGAIDRFHALPIRRSSVLAGHAVANLLKALVPITLMSLAGLAVGWRVQGGVLDAIAAYGVMIVFSFAIIWVGVLLGSVVATPEGVQGIAFVAIFPITFVASTFVPVTTLPTGLRQFAEWNPVTALAGALRNLFANPGGVTPAHGPWSLMHPVLYTLLWGAGDRRALRPARDQPLPGVDHELSNSSSCKACTGTPGDLSICCESRRVYGVLSESGYQSGMTFLRQSRTRALLLVAAAIVAAGGRREARLRAQHDRADRHRHRRHRHEPRVPGRRSGRYRHGAHVLRRGPHEQSCDRRRDDHQGRHPGHRTAATRLKSSATTARTTWPCSSSRTPRT